MKFTACPTCGGAFAGSSCPACGHTITPCFQIAAIDYSTRGADIARLPLEPDDNHATWTEIQFPGSTSLERTRNIRDAMPARGSWADDGTVLIVLERPMSRSPQALVPLTRTLGAIHACLPTGIDVWELSASEWRSELGLRTNARRADAKAEARDFAAVFWEGMPPVVTQDAMDAFCLAVAARRMCERAAAA